MALRSLGYLSLLTYSYFILGCQPQLNLGSSSSSTSSSSNTATGFSFSSNDAVQINTQIGITGSFNAATPPASGGLSISYSRLFNLDGTLMKTPPSWFVTANLFLTSTCTSGGAPCPYTGGNITPCAYFHSKADDNSASTNGFYTMSGYAPSLNPNYIDQCAGTNVNELNQVGISITLNRSFMNATDKFMVVVNAKPMNVPITTPNPNTCTAGGNFNPTGCANTLYSLSMRPQARGTPLLIQYLFPSAKALDLLSESILVPINTQPTYTVISIDRVKGGAIFYGVTIIRLP